MPTRIFCSSFNERVKTMPYRARGLAHNHGYEPRGKASDPKYRSPALAGFFDYAFPIRKCKSHE